MWLRKDLERMNYEQLQRIMDEWNNIDVCPPVYHYPRYADDKEPDTVSKSLTMMNWLLGRPTEIPQALVDEKMEYAGYKHGSRMAGPASWMYRKYYREMVKARSSFAKLLIHDHTHQIEQEGREKKRKWRVGQASQRHNKFKI